MDFLDFERKEIRDFSLIVIRKKSCENREKL